MSEIYEFDSSSNVTDAHNADGRQYRSYSRMAWSRPLVLRRPRLNFGHTGRSPVLAPFHPGWPLLVIGT